MPSINVPSTSRLLLALGGAAIAQRASFDPAVEYTGGGQEFGEEHQLSVRRGPRGLVPPNVYAPAHRLDHQGFLGGHGQRRLARLFAFTLLVSLLNQRNPLPVLRKSAQVASQLPDLG
jgi:hypothetical protein